MRENWAQRIKYLKSKQCSDAEQREMQLKVDAKPMLTELIVKERKRKSRAAANAVANAETGVGEVMTDLEMTIGKLGRIQEDHKRAREEMQDRNCLIKTFKAM